MELFDTHAHLDDEAFAGVLDGVLQRARSAGVKQILTVGISAASSEQCVAFAERYQGVLAAAGIQPNYAAQVQPGDWDRIVRLVEGGRVAAIGETGLDRHWDYAPFPLQQDYFDRHLRLAQQFSLPVVIHLRDCEAELLAMLEEAVSRGPLRGVMHSFSGSLATAEACLDLGLHLSYSGMATYKKADALRRTAARTPLDRLLLETDAPYLSPEPVRGVRPNEPAHLVHTAARLAQLYDVSPEELARQTTENALRLFCP